MTHDTPHDLIRGRCGLLPLLVFNFDTNFQVVARYRGMVSSGLAGELEERMGQSMILFAIGMINLSNVKMAGVWDMKRGDVGISRCMYKIIRKRAPQLSLVLGRLPRGMRRPQSS